MNIEKTPLEWRGRCHKHEQCVRIGGMQWYACKFCIALHGIPRGGRNELPTDRGQVEVHLRHVHGYPGRSARDILGSEGDRGLAAELIENSGPILVVHPLEGLP